MAADVEALADAVRWLKALPPEERKRMALQGRSYYERHFDPGALAVQLMRQLEAVVQACADDTTKTKA